jgi:phospholipid/cholesterol/gamma-HCH transport system substrate-binding protein
MRGKLNEFQVGLITIVSVAVLVSGMMWLKNMDLRKGSRLYLVDFARVEGMRQGDRVQVRGIRMGEVVGMEILQEAVRVSLALDETVDLREDAVITLGEKGIVGEVVIEVDPGTGAPVAEGHVFVGRTAGTIASMTDAAGAAITEMRSLTAQVIELIEQVKTEGMVVETLEQANATLVKVDDMVTQNHEDVRAILDDLRHISADLRSVTGSGRIQETLDNTAAAAAAADSALAAVNSAVGRLDSLMLKLEEGDGTAAKLLNDPALYARTDSTLTSLQRLLDEIRRNPKKFFKVSVIDF